MCARAGWEGSGGRRMKEGDLPGFPYGYAPFERVLYTAVRINECKCDVDGYEVRVFWFTTGLS